MSQSTHVESASNDDDPRPGDHVFVRRALGYTHHGVMVAPTEVIHFSGEPGSKSDATIRRSTLEEFAAGGTVEVRQYGVRLDRENTIQRAESRLGESSYHLVINNCEHFARWCTSGEKRSRQVDTASNTILTAGTSVVGAVGTAYSVASAGFVGISGAGIMSGLASIGFGGAAGGIVSLAAGPTIATVALTHRGLRDQEDLPESDRKSRRDGRRATIIGATGATAAIVPTLSAVGTAGLSGAGITSGLAAVGGVVGGGMLAGTVVLAAAPAVVAGGAGYGIYAIAKRVRRSSSPEVEPGLS